VSDDALAKFQAAYALERQLIDRTAEEMLVFERHEYQWWDWYYYDQFNWRSMTKAEAKSMVTEPKEKPRKKK
jgi:hypothetical protein